VVHEFASSFPQSFVYISFATLSSDGQDPVDVEGTRIPRVRCNCLKYVLEILASLLGFSRRILPETTRDGLIDSEMSVSDHIDLLMRIWTSTSALQCSVSDLDFEKIRRLNAAVKLVAPRGIRNRFEEIQKVVLEAVNFRPIDPLQSLSILRAFNSYNSNDKKDAVLQIVHTGIFAGYICVNERDLDVQFAVEVAAEDVDPQDTMHLE
jgi:hypothetical protein